MSNVDAWDETSGNGILGEHLKIAKGTWTLVGGEFRFGPDGIKLAVIMPTVVVGQVLWTDGQITEREVGRIEDGFRAISTTRAMNENHPGWSPYTQFLGVRCDDGHVGELLTFTSSAWGGRFAFESLKAMYALKRRREFPIVILGTKARGDVNHNIDGTFTAVGWTNRSNFAELLAEAPETAPALTHAIEPKKLNNDIEYTGNKSGPGDIPGFEDIIPF